MDDLSIVPTYRRNFRTVLSLNDEEVRRANNLSPSILAADETAASYEEPLLDSEVSISHPRDRFHFVKVTFFLLGITMLLPWNFFINASDFWMYKFRNVSMDTVETLENKTTLQKMFFSYLSIASNIPLLLCLFLSTALNHKVRQEIRNTLSLVSIMNLLIITVVLAHINTDQWQDRFFAITMAIVVLMNAFGAWLQGGIGGLASLLPEKYMHIMVVGMAVGGLFASVAQIFSMLTVPNPTNSAIIYFSLAVVFQGFTLLCFLIMLKTEFFRYFMKHPEGNLHRLFGLADLEVKVSLKMLFRKIWPYAVSMMLVFWVTLSVFPAVTVLVVSVKAGSDSPLTGRLFTPVACYLLFNCGDFVGRLISYRFPLPKSSEKLMLTLSCLRFIYIPLLMFCNAQPRHYLPVIFNSDISFIIFIVLFGCSNGYLCAVTMMQGPKKVEYYLQEKAGTMMTAFMGVGITLGSFTSLLLVHFL